MDVLGSVGGVLRNFSLTQNNLQRDVRALASGLRVQSAADDPSGLAISQSLQSKVNGLNQSVQNVQTAKNLLTVADGALASVQQILQRIRSLTVEARSDINSDQQLHNIQSEIDQLLLEVNKISSTTNFNGLTLLDGRYTQQFPANISNLSSYGAVPLSNTVLDTTGNPGSSSVSTTWTDGSGRTSNQLVTLSGNGTGLPTSYTPAEITFKVLSYDSNPVDQLSGPVGGPGMYVQITAYNYTHNPAFGSGDMTTYLAAVNLNDVANATTPYAISTAAANASGGGGGGASLQGLLDAFFLAPINQNDIGATISFRTISPVSTADPNAGPLHVNDGGVEGSTVGLSLPNVNTQALDLNGITVLRPTTCDYVTNTPTGTSSSNLVSAADAQQRTDDALQSISFSRAQLGAQMTALGYDATNDDNAIVNLTASESSITDASIGTFATDFTKNQILTQLGQQVLSSSMTDAKQLTSLLFTGSAVA